MHPSGVAKSSTSFGWGKNGNVTSAGWQVTLCDPIWHVSSRSGVVRPACKCYTLTLLFTFMVVITKNFVTCREFDGLFRCNSDHLRNKATVETEESFVLDDFAEAVVTVPVHHLVHRRRQTLVLHTRLYEVDWVHGRRADCWITTHKILCTNSPTYLLTYLLNIKAVTGDFKVGEKNSWLFPGP